MVTDNWGMSDDELLKWARGCAPTFANLTGEDLVMTVVEDNSTFTGMARAFMILDARARGVAAS